MATTTPNFGWDVPQSTDLVKDGATAIAALGNDIDTSLVDLKGGTTGQVLSKASNTDMDFIWSSVDPLTILDAKGDLISATAADTPARLAVGADGTYLQADSTTSTGLKWGTISAGGMTLISRQTPSASTGFSFSSISGTYTDLYIRWAGLYVSNTSTEFRMRLNNASSGYVTGNFKQDEGSGSTVNAFPSNTNTQMGQSWSLLYNNNTASFANGSSGFARVYNYANTSYVKDYEYYNRFSDGGFKGEIVFGIYNSTSAITSVDIVRTTGTGTVSTVTNGFIELWGVK